MAAAAALDAAARFEKEDLARAWEQLERAHILSQPDAGLHVRVHLAMLWLAVHSCDVREIIAQLLRLPLAAPASWLGRYPRGNPGSGRVSAFVETPIPPDLAEYLDTRS
jgi:hypothetical protein